MQILSDSINRQIGFIAGCLLVHIIWWSPSSYPSSGGAMAGLQIIFEFHEKVQENDT